MDVTFKLTPHDYVELQRFRFARPINFVSFILPGLSCLTFVILWATQRMKWFWLFTAIIICGAALCGILIGRLLLSWVRKRRAKVLAAVLAPAADYPEYFAETTVSISSEGVRVKKPYEDTLDRWNAVRFIEENKPYIYVSAPSGGLTIIPQSAFKSPDETRRFLDSARSYRKSAKASR